MILPLQNITDHVQYQLWFPMSQVPGEPGAILTALHYSPTTAPLHTLCQIHCVEESQAEIK